MSLGNKRYVKNGDYTVCIGEDFVCDVCGETEPPNGGMAEPFNDGRHLCRMCLASHLIDDIKYNYLPEIILVRGTPYVFASWPFKANKRKPRVPAAIRREVLAAGKCAYCGTKENLQIDHIVPYSKGGSNDKENLQCLCGSCNSSKGDKIKHDHLRRLLPQSKGNNP